jgi:hypothetical protein
LVPIERLSEADPCARSDRRPETKTALKGLRQEVLRTNEIEDKNGNSGIKVYVPGSSS